MEKTKQEKNKLRKCKHSKLICNPKIMKLSQCYSCKKTFFIEDMTPIILIQPQEEANVEVKRYLCGSCEGNLKKYKFIEEGKKERKKNLKRLVKEIREKERR